ncbi:MAG: DUF975 family protein [Treponema sp.]|nr:DUF975 family protein [Treponema sp.]
MFNRKNCKKAALKSLKGRWKTPVLVNLFYLALILIIMLPYFCLVLAPIANLSDTNSVMFDGNVDSALFYVAAILIFALLAMVFVICIYPPLIMGYKKIPVLLSNTTEKINFKEIFSGFKMYGKSMGVYWWNYLWIFLWMLVFYVPMIILTAISTSMLILSNSADVNFALMGSMAVVAILQVAVIIGLYVVIINRTLAYGMMWYIVCDDNKVGAIDSMNISKAITKKHLWSLFVLNLSFIGWFLLCLLTLGIGFLWLLPYVETTNYEAYKVLRDEYYAKESNKEPKQLVNKIEPKDETSEESKE